MGFIYLFFRPKHFLSVSSDLLLKARTWVVLLIRILKLLLLVDLLLIKVISFHKRYILTLEKKKKKREREREGETEGREKLNNHFVIFGEWPIEIFSFFCCFFRFLIIMLKNIKSVVLLVVLTFISDVRLALKNVKVSNIYFFQDWEKNNNNFFD